MNLNINNYIAEIENVLTRDGYAPHPGIAVEENSDGLSLHKAYSLKAVGIENTEQSGSGFVGVYEFQLEITYYNETADKRNQNFIEFDYLNSELMKQPSFKGWSSAATFEDDDLDTTIGVFRFCYGIKSC